MVSEMAQAAVLLWLPELALPGTRVGAQRALGSIISAAKALLLPELYRGIDHGLKLRGFSVVAAVARTCVEISVADAGKIGAERAVRRGGYLV